MGSKRSYVVAVVSAVAAMALLMGQAGASSNYNMKGTGTLTMGGAGFPLCAGVVGECVNADISFSWGQLIVDGIGTLDNQSVDAQYSCASEGAIDRNGDGDNVDPNEGFQTRIKGNTSNFELTFNFKCTKQAGGTGPAFINGWFSNVKTFSTNSRPHSPKNSDAYANVGSHPNGSLSAAGSPSFVGFFKTSNTHPYDIGASNGVPSHCSGGFAPATISGTRMTTATFLGECTAIN